MACAADRGARPFLVQTAEGTVHATQARFVVRQLAGRTSVQALAGALEVRPHTPTREGRATTRLDAGQRLDFDARGTGPVIAADAGADAWTDGVLVAPANAAALADSVGDLLANPTRAAALGAEARLRVCEHFTLERERSADLTILEGLLKPR